MPIAECGFKDTGAYPAADRLAYFGPTLEALVGFDKAFQVGSGQVPNLPSSSTPALVDTGAAISCIDANLVDSLNLPFVNTQVFAGIAGQASRSIHLAQVRVPSLGFTMYGEFASADLEGKPHNVLLGRNFPAHFRMVYEGRTGMVIVENESPPAHKFYL